MALLKIQLNGRDALQDSDTDKIAILPEGHMLLETLFGIVGALDKSGTELQLQFYEKLPSDRVSREIFFPPDPFTR